MANPHSREFPPYQHKPLDIPTFPDDTDSRTASARAPPWPLSAADFMDLQLRELAQLNDRLNRLNQPFHPFIEACLAGIVPIEALTTVCLYHFCIGFSLFRVLSFCFINIFITQSNTEMVLVRWRGEVHELTGHAEQVTASHYQRRIQVRRRQSEER